MPSYGASVGDDLLLDLAVVAVVTAVLAVVTVVLAVVVTVVTYQV